MNDFDTLDLTGMELTSSQTNLTPVSNQLRKLSDTIQEYAKLVFLIDVSGSMSSAVGGYDSATEYGDRISRMELVKKMAKQEIEARFKKFPDSHVAVVRFGSHAETVFDEGRLTDVPPALDKLNCHGHLAGGTDIMSSLRKAMTVCREHPSPVGVHHFIVVSDGGDGGTCVLPEWLPALKASGVVLDYIHVGDSSYHNEPLEKACVALHGEFVVVDSVAAFEEKFLAAVNRVLMIEAGQ